jgi:predicted MFS family arabinose efflux permease
VFVLPLVLISVSAVMSSRFAPNSKEDTGHRFDVVGSVLSALAIGGLVLGIHEGPEKGWTYPLTMVALTLGLVTLALFIVWERRQAAPLLDISAFSDRGLAAGSVTLLIVFAVMFGIFLVLFPFFQAVLGWSALKSAAAMLPMTVVMMPMSTVAPKIARRFGRRNTMATGVAIFASGLTMMAVRASVEGGYLSILPGLIVIGLGMGLTMTPSTEAITETLPLEKQGVASALNDVSRELGGAVGIALLGSVVTAGYRSAIGPALAGVSPEFAEPAKEGLGSAFAVAAKAGDQGPQILDAAKHAFVNGWTHSMWLGVGMAAVAFVFLIVRGPARVPAAQPTAGLQLVEVG